MTTEDINRLLIYTDMAIHKFNLELRKVRRNKDLIQDRYDRTPSEIIRDSGIESPDEQIESIKAEKDIAVFIRKKLERKIRS